MNGNWLMNFPVCSASRPAVVASTTAARARRTSTASCSCDPRLRPDFITRWSVAASACTLTRRITYQVGLNDFQSEWVCPEHDGWARQKFEQWWLRRSNDPLPDTAERAVDIAEAGGLARTHRITVRKVTGEQFDRIVGYFRLLAVHPSPR